MNNRLIQPADNSTLKMIIQQGLAQHDLAIPGTAYFDPELDDLARYYAQSQLRDYYVVEDQGKVVGGAGFGEYLPDQGIAELQKLYFAPEAKGHGWSYQLINHIEEAARKAGYRKLYLETHSNLTAAIHIYEKAGFHLLEQPIQAAAHQTMNRFYIKMLS